MELLITVQQYIHNPVDPL